MDWISFTGAGQRWAVPVAAAAPLTAAVGYHYGSGLAVGLSAMGALAGAAAAILRHVQQLQQQRDQHHEVMFREGNQHAEVMLALAAGASAADVVDVARAVRGIRGTPDPNS